LQGITDGLTKDEIHARFDTHRPENAAVSELAFVPLPHNREYELDYHRPYIDELTLVAKDGARLVRIPEVVDCWLESGSMPFAEYHYPFEHKSEFEKRSPGDFIAEYIAQTRTWFYYLHAVGVALFDRQSFKHVVNTGTILAQDGSKMSKSKGNFTDPLSNLDRFGADALRLYLLTSVVMQAEDVKFKDEELKETHNRTINILWNAYSFYAMHATGADTNTTHSPHVLDRWVLARLSQLTQEVTSALDAYDTVRAGRTLRDFVTDLSTWYIRRSRDRFKEEGEDRQYALATARYVFETLATLVAPLTPFIAEDIYRGAKGKEESVHLAAWPSMLALSDEDRQLLTNMEEVRRIVSLGLEARARANIKVRQPLAKLAIKKEKKETVSSKELPKELLALIQDEVNVRTVMYEDISENVLLDTTLTDELVQEGRARDLVRSVQDLRKRMELVPQDRVRLTISEDKTFVESCRDALKKVAGVEEIVYGSNDELSIEKIT
jgi:isoleucyl-tRNA synthetase